MTRIDVGNDVPGIRSLMMFRPETGEPLTQLAEALLRGDGPLSRGERELIAARVSRGNDCTFCAMSHGAVAAGQLDDGWDTVEAVWADDETAPGVTPKMRALLTLADEVREGGGAVTDRTVEAARGAGADDVEIHDTVLIAAAFCMFNRYVDGLGAVTPSDRGAYDAMAEMIIGQGYARPLPSSGSAR